MKKALSPVQKIQNSILNIRGYKAMIDRDLADLYGIETKRLNEQVKRNKDRFPPDFMFKLTKAEKEWVVANCDHLQGLKFSTTLPYAFTEHGAIMLASILNTKIAVKTSILVVRAFVYLRSSTYTNQELTSKILELESRYDGKFSIVFKALKQLIDKPIPPRKQIGFKTKREE